MTEDRSRGFRRIAVVTGDHFAPDSTKPGGRYNPEDLATHEAMKAAFMELPGFEFAFLNDHTRLFETIEADRPDLVVNFCDTGYRNDIALELHIPAHLEIIGVPYTGAAPAAIATCYDKQVVRLVADALGIAVPREAFVRADAAPADLPDLLPALLKPNKADGSLGITKNAVCRTRAEAEAYFRWLQETLPGRDVLVQEYLPGAEFGVGLIGNPATGLVALPVLEVDFSGLPAGLNPILSYESKSLPDSPYWTDIRFKAAALAPEAAEGLVASAKRLFERLGLRDYARFDFRTGADGVIKLMEVNPNPAWANDGKLAFMAGFAGIAYRDMLAMILDAAIARVLAGRGK